ncbi:MAG: PEP-CTERM sorting domain-containing protein [Planctomycetota bacterium]
MSFNKIAVSTAALLGAAVLLPAQGAVLVDYDIVGNSPGTSYLGPVAANSSDANITPGTLGTVGVGNVSSAGNKSNSLGGNSWESGGFQIGTDYLGWSLTVDSGFTMDIDAIHFNEAMNNSFANPPGEWLLRSSLDNFATDAATGSITSGFQDITGTNTYTLINLGPEFDGLTGTVEFRLYAELDGNFSPQWFISDPTDGPFTNFTVEGSTAVIPEPASLALLGVGATCFLARRRKG